jgi:alkylation response protein AidB-like acyl-CoA dehydrogenase
MAMQLAWSHDDLKFRDEVRAFLDSELTPDLKAAAAGMTSVYAPPHVALAWQAKLHAKGWIAPSWPTEWGGCDWSVARRYIFARETTEAGAPPLSPMGLGMCGPVLLHYGTDAQKRRFLQLGHGGWQLGFTRCWLAANPSLQPPDPPRLGAEQLEHRNLQKPTRAGAKGRARARHQRWQNRVPHQIW